MKQIPIANWKVPKAASRLVLPSHISGATQLILVSVAIIADLVNCQILAFNIICTL